MDFFIVFIGPERIHMKEDQISIVPPNEVIEGGRRKNGVEKRVAFLKGQNASDI